MHFTRMAEAPQKRLFTHSRSRSPRFFLRYMNQAAPGATRQPTNLLSSNLSTTHRSHTGHWNALSRTLPKLRLNHQPHNDWIIGVTPANHHPSSLLSSLSIFFFSSCCSFLRRKYAPTSTGRHPEPHRGACGVEWLVSETHTHPWRRALLPPARSAYLST